MLSACVVFIHLFRYIEFRFAISQNKVSVYHSNINVNLKLKCLTSHLCTPCETLSYHLISIAHKL